MTFRSLGLEITNKEWEWDWDLRKKFGLRNEIYSAPPLRYFGALMVSACDSGSSSPGLSPGRGHCIQFVGKTLYSSRGD